MMSPLIAIIDDDAGIREALRTLLRSATYRAEAFASAEAFVASEGSSRSDCIITDIAMQGMSGLELAGLLKSRGCTVPVILISALTDEDLERQAQLNGAQCLLRKPIESNTLISQVEESLACRRTDAGTVALASHWY